jgi:hypothetical protein
MDMTFQVRITTRTGQAKFQKDAITGNARTFETRERAQKAADSSFALARCDWKNEGRRLSKLEVVEVAA